MGKFSFGKLVSFPCPECGCITELSENAENARCAVCDCEIDVAKEVAKSKLVSNSCVSVIKYEGNNDTFVWKHPIEDFNLGSQLIVHESQEAVFFMNGQALDTFGPGRYSLETENLPVLKQLQSLQTGKQNPFHAEIYFINKTVQMSIPWGTADRIHFVDPETDAPIDIGVSGEMNLRVSDGRKLLIKLVGTTSGISWGDPNGVNDEKEHYINARKAEYDRFSHSLRMYFKPLIRTTVKTNLAKIIKNEKIDILEIDENLETLSNALREKLLAGFEEYGLTIPEFYVTNVSLPADSDENFIKIKKFRTEKLRLRDEEFELKMRLAKQKADLEAQRGALDFDKIEAEKARIKAESDAEVKKIGAQADADSNLVKGLAEAEVMRGKGLAEADVMRGKGLAEADTMRAQGYDKKDEMAADVQKAFAGGLANMGSGGGGGIVSDVVSTGAAMATMGIVADKMKDAIGGISDSSSSFKFTSPTEAPKAENFWECSCGYKENRGKFCSDCGKPKPEEWDCPTCESKGNKGKFCPECGSPKPSFWDCACGAHGNRGKFCSECGAAKEST